MVTHDPLSADQNPERRSWAHGKGWPWTPSRFTKAHHPRPFYALHAGRPEMALRPFLVWPARREGTLQPSSALLDTQRRTSMKTITGMTTSSAYHPKFHWHWLEFFVFITLTPTDCSLKSPYGQFTVRLFWATHE
jgi:hypothetical protein